MIFQSVNTAWAQVPVIVPPAQPMAAQAMQAGDHCAKMAKHVVDAVESQNLAFGKGKTGCHCCDKPCTPNQCAAMHLQAALTDLNIVVALALGKITSARFSQIVGTLYHAPPTPPPNAV